jgi:iron-sulfur cluster insertion protein
MEHINRAMTMGEIVDKFPEVVETLLGMGVHCVGCNVSPYESLQDGFTGHGFSDAEIGTALGKLNQVVDEKRKVVEEPLKGGKLEMSNLAVEKIKEFCGQKNKQALRLAVKVGGCSGKEYVFDLADVAMENDIVLSQNGAKVYVDKVSMQSVDGSLINYNDGLTGAGFVVENPNASKNCGCGKSFS